MHFLFDHHSGRDTRSRQLVEGFSPSFVTTSATAVFDGIHYPEISYLSNGWASAPEGDIYSSGFEDVSEVDLGDMPPIRASSQPVTMPSFASENCGKLFRGKCCGQPLARSG